jgi:hypothetical protein
MQIPMRRARAATTRIVNRGRYRRDRRHCGRKAAQFAGSPPRGSGAFE